MSHVDLRRALIFPEQSTTDDGHVNIERHQGCPEAVRHAKQSSSGTQNSTPPSLPCILRLEGGLVSLKPLINLYTSLCLHMRLAEELDGKTINGGLTGFRQKKVVEELNMEETKRYGSRFYNTPNPIENYELMPVFPLNHALSEHRISKCTSATLERNRDEDIKNRAQKLLEEFLAVPISDTRNHQTMHPPEDRKDDLNIRPTKYRKTVGEKRLPAYAYQYSPAEPNSVNYADLAALRDEDTEEPKPLSEELGVFKVNSRPITSYQALVEGLPKLQKGIYHTKSSAPHPVSFTGNLAPWLDFDRDVRLAFTTHTGALRRSHISLQPRGEASRASTMANKRQG
ncbi:uncharacterized protein KD926_008856 [Aspergillus affinis]|uniref:uncharacterized protein n=1 Tax=Aspergillus affinis TaxID=1070780 RepID=UPI0022FDC0EB|nr:uncharacterized protein KD926_008856 [Aspergillus affinis]KAI9045429.1 hypothetical protein KD926_008856 [Aspergillus affinis]